MPSLATTLADIRDRIAKASKRRLNEQNTKATLIEPVLRALGWDVEDFDEVQREFKQKKRDKPVDYGLLVMRTPRLFVEAKALGENLNDRRWANQIMGYALVAGVEWIVLTDGDEYRIYNTHAPVEVDQKLFRTVRVSDNDELVQPTLELLTKDRMEENQLELLWRAQFVDGQVRAAIEQVFAADNDMFLVNHILKATKNLDAHEVRSSLARCRLTVDFPVQTRADMPPPRKPGRRKKKATSSRKKAPAQHSTTVSDLIEAGLLLPPVKLTRTYKGKALEAQLRPDGHIKFGRRTYDSLSTAAGAARASVSGTGQDGKLPATNG